MGVPGAARRAGTPHQIPLIGPRLLADLTHRQVHQSREAVPPKRAVGRGFGIGEQPGDLGAESKLLLALLEQQRHAVVRLVLVGKAVLGQVRPHELVVRRAPLGHCVVEERVVADRVVEVERARPAVAIEQLPRGKAGLRPWRAAVHQHAGVDHLLGQRRRRIGVELESFAQDRLDLGAADRPAQRGDQLGERAAFEHEVRVEERVLAGEAVLRRPPPRNQKWIQTQLFDGVGHGFSKRTTRKTAVRRSCPGRCGRRSRPASSRARDGGLLRRRRGRS